MEKLPSYRSSADAIADFFTPEYQQNLLRLPFFAGVQCLGKIVPCTRGNTEEVLFFASHERAAGLYFSAADAAVANHRCRGVDETGWWIDVDLLASWKNNRVMGRMLLLLWFALSTLAGESLCCCALRDWLSDGGSLCAADLQEVPRSCCRKPIDTTSTQDQDKEPSNTTLPGPCSCSYCPPIALSTTAEESPQATLHEGLRWQWSDFLPQVHSGQKLIEAIPSKGTVLRSTTEPMAGRILCVLYCTLRC